MKRSSPIIVAGAGPVGLTAALILAQYGLHVLLLEKRKTLNKASKASTFHPPTLEILNGFGIMDTVFRLGQAVPTIQYRERGGKILAEFHLADLAGETKFPIRIHVEQAVVMPLILEQLLTHPNAEVRFNTGVVGVKNYEDHVEVETSGVNGHEVFCGEYLLASDGAQSDTRRLLDVDFEGFTYTDRVLRVFTRLNLDTILPHIAPLTYLYSGEKSLSFLKMPDCWRMVLRAPASVGDDEALSPPYFRKRLGEYLGEDVSYLTDLWADVFEIGKRAASTFFKGRTVFMGDAAHISSTRGGMNMNCGIHDAYAISNAVIAAMNNGDKGIVEEAALERRHVAKEELLHRTDKVIASGSEWLSFAEQCARQPALKKKFLRTATMLDMWNKAA